jgi:AmmeMemoRadiSam system protein B
MQKGHPGIPPNLAPGERILAGIVTHHFLASGLMVRFFATLRAESSPETIVLIGPNHFHHGSANVSVSSLPWKTPFGLLETDGRIVRQLQATTNLPEDPEAFTGEHSVGVLMPFLKYYFPSSRVVPILVDINAREEQLRELRPLLAEFLVNPKLIVILSMDFSHDSIASIADSRDVLAQGAMIGLNADEVKQLNVDCPKGLWLLLAALRDVGQVKTQVNEHTNSARLTGRLNQPNVTSYFTMYFLK